MTRLLIAFLILPALATAEVVSIRSGEHESFSRLVLSIEAETDWRLDETDSGFKFTLINHDDGFDLGQVFERIPRKRLSGIEQNSLDTLDLELACDCLVEGFLWRPDRLVLDISETNDPVILAEPVSMRLPAPNIQFEIADNSVELPDVANLTNGLSLTGFAADVTLMDETQVIEFQDSEEGNLSEAALLDGIARAASQGLLNPSIDVPTLTHSDDVMPEPVPDEPVIVESDLHLNLMRPGIDISTALDQGLAGLGNALRGSMEQHCLPSDLFVIADWGDGRSLHEQVAGLSESLAGEFGEEPIEAETDLARLYLHFGFGAEALSVLSISQSSSQSRQVLYELGNIIDGIGGAYPLLMAQRNCDTSGALWAFIAAPEKPDTDNKSDALTRSLFELPQPLRGYIAPRVSQGFLSVNMPDYAELVLRATNNRDVELDTTVQTTRALIAERNNDPAEALVLLNEQANDTARMTPEAAIRLITLTLEQGEVPSESDLILLAALGHEYEGSEIAEEVSATEALGWSARGHYNRGIELLGNRTDELAKQTRDAIFLELTEEGPSADFLELAMVELPVGVSTYTENVMAGRLNALGFPSYALAVMKGSATRAEAAERRYLKAEASLDLQDYSQAISEIQGLNDERARNLRAAAYSGLGDFRNAIEALDENQDGSTAELQFRARAWERLTLEDDAILSDFAKTVISVVDPSSIETLEDRRSLLDASQESRLAVEGLLNRYDGTTPSVVSP